MKKHLASTSEPLLRREMPELDTIRGIAVLAVILYHGLFWKVPLSHFSWPERVFLSGMWAGRFGVNLFFVLSGFLITGILVDSLGRADYFKRFYIRRALRIIPAYLAIVVVLYVFNYAPGSFLILSLLYLSNLTPLFGVAMAYPVLWSLAVEEHFYFLWPAVVRNVKQSTLIGICTAVVIATPFLRLATYFLTIHNGFVSYACNEYTWNCLDGLSCGGALAIFLRQYQPTRKALLRLSGVLTAGSIAIWILSFPFGIVTTKTPVGAALQVVPWHLFFTALLGIFLLVGTGPLKAFVRVRLLQFLGFISYGLYLIHLLVFELFDRFSMNFSKHLPNISTFAFLILRLAVVLTISITISYLSRRYFEEHFLRLKGRFS